MKLVGGISLVVQWLRVCLPVQGIVVQEGEVRSHGPQLRPDTAEETNILKEEKVGGRPGRSFWTAGHNP